MKWEYFRLATVENSLDEALRELGEEGWELVAIQPETRMFHGYQCILKRPHTGAESVKRSSPPVPHRFNKFLSVR